MLRLWDKDFVVDLTAARDRPLIESLPMAIISPILERAKLYVRAAAA
jgi:hypothetical protein